MVFFRYIYAYIQEEFGQNTILMGLIIWRCWKPIGSETNMISRAVCSKTNTISWAMCSETNKTSQGSSPLGGFILRCISYRYRHIKFPPGTFGQHHTRVGVSSAMNLSKSIFPVICGFSIFFKNIWDKQKIWPILMKLFAFKKTTCQLVTDFQTTKKSLLDRKQ